MTTTTTGKFQAKVVRGGEVDVTCKYCGEVETMDPIGLLRLTVAIADSEGLETDHAQNIAIVQTMEDCGHKH